MTDYSNLLFRKWQKRMKEFYAEKACTCPKGNQTLKRAQKICPVHSTKEEIERDHNETNKLMQKPNPSYPKPKQ